MNEKEKELFKSMVECLDELPEVKKGEFLGYAKCMADMKRKNRSIESGEEDKAG